MKDQSATKPEAVIAAVESCLMAVVYNDWIRTEMSLSFPARTIQTHTNTSMCVYTVLLMVTLHREKSAVKENKMSLFGCADRSVKGILKPCILISIRNGVKDTCMRTI